MKQPIKIVRDMVDKYPNDMELGARVRWYIKWFYETEEFNQSNGYLEISYDGGGMNIDCSFKKEK